MGFKIAEAIVQWGDATSTWNVNFPEGARVKDALRWITSRASEGEEYGTVNISAGSGSLIELKFDYRAKQKRYLEFPSNGATFMLHKKITDFRAHGGWGLMDYTIFIDLYSGQDAEPETPVYRPVQFEKISPDDISDADLNTAESLLKMQLQLIEGIRKKKRGG